MTVTRGVTLNISHLEIITKGKPTLISGDFNICYSANKNNRLSQGLEKNGFSQLVKQATHIRGGHIDHAYWRDQEQTWEEPQINRYSPYYSDHDGLCLTLIKKVNVSF